MPLNFALASKAYAPVEVTLAGEQIQAYAAASGDLADAYHIGEGSIASPIFAVADRSYLFETVRADGTIVLVGSVRVGGSS